MEVLGCAPETSWVADTILIAPIVYSLTFPLVVRISHFDQLTPSLPTGLVV